MDVGIVLGTNPAKMIEMIVVKVALRTAKITKAVIPAPLWSVIKLTVAARLCENAVLKASARIFNRLRNNPSLTADIRSKMMD